MVCIIYSQIWLVLIRPKVAGGKRSLTAFAEQILLQYANILEDEWKPDNNWLGCKIVRIYNKNNIVAL
jgi:hypothetical protein